MPGRDLPNYNIPPYDGIGANEYIVDVTHEVPGPDGKPVPAVDFMSTVDTPYVWELNMWYHTLNCGYRTRISGETDFPCIYGERVGVGRSYVKLDGKLDFDAWCDGIQAGRCYVSDGHSHLLDFTAEYVHLDAPGVDRVHVGKGRQRNCALPKAGKVLITLMARQARLPDEPDNDIETRSYERAPYWHLKRAVIPGSGKVPVEVIVNGFPAARQEIEADGSLHNLSFDVDLTQSRWVAVRILPSSHTNLGVRACRRQADLASLSKRSADWSASKAWTAAGRKSRSSSRPERWTTPRPPTSMRAACTGR